MFIIFKLLTIVSLIQRSPSHRGTDSDSVNWNQIRPYLNFLTWSSISTLYKKLSCRRQTTWRFVSLNILLSHPRSLKIIQN